MTPTPWFTVRAAADDVVDVAITGPIEPETAPRLIREIARARTVRLTIASPGGDARAGLNIAHALRGRRAEVHVVAALSAATLPLAAARYATIAADAVVMIHGPHAAVSRDATLDAATLRRTSAELDAIRDEMLTVYAYRVRRSRAEIARMMNETAWLDAQGAVALGLADKVVGAPAVAIAARFDPAAVARLGTIPPWFAARIAALTGRATSSGLSVREIYAARNAPPVETTAPSSHPAKARAPERRSFTAIARDYRGGAA